MSDDLITSLRALAAARHDDLSIAVDAVIEIERLREEIERLRADNERLRAEVQRKTRHVEQLYDQIRRRADERDKAQIEVERLREALVLGSEVLASHQGSPQREWHSGGAWLYPGDSINVVRAPLPEIKVEP